jgi:Family of unknown function (DUF5906)
MYFEPSAENNWVGGFVCHHGHCKDVRGIHDLAEYLGVDQAWLDVLNAEYFVVQDGGRTSVCSEVMEEGLNHTRLTFQSFNAFRELHLHQTIKTADKPTPMGHAWLMNPKRRQYKRIVMSPLVDRPGCYNLWRGFSVDPTPGDWSLFRDHILGVACDGDTTVYEYVLDWMATAVQFPDRPAGTSIVMRGDEGSGKGYLVRMYGRLWGRHYQTVTSSKHLVGCFNGHLRNCILLFADEAFYAGDKAGEQVLKALITEPTLNIEEKGRDIEVMPNMLHIMMASNSDWVVPAAMDARRFCVLDVSGEHVKGRTYFNTIDEQMEAGGLAAMLYDLQRRDLSGFDIGKVPKTRGLVDQKKLSLSGISAWWYQVLHRGGFMVWDKEEKREVLQDWQERVPRGTLFEDYLKTAKDAGVSRRSMETMVGMQLRKLLPDGGLRSVRAGERTYLLPGLQVCRAAFASAMKASVEDLFADGGTGEQTPF